MSFASYESTCTFVTCLALDEAQLPWGMGCLWLGRGAGGAGGGELFWCEAGGEVVNDAADGVQGGAVLVGYLDAEGAFQGDGELDGIEGIGSEVLFEAHFAGGLDAKLVEDSLFHLFCHTGIRCRLGWSCGGLRRKHSGRHDGDEACQKLAAGGVK